MGIHEFFYGELWLVYCVANVGFVAAAQRNKTCLQAVQRVRFSAVTGANKGLDTFIQGAARVMLLGWSSAGGGQVL